MIYSDFAFCLGQGIDLFSLIMTIAFSSNNYFRYPFVISLLIDHVKKEEISQNDAKKNGEEENQS